MGDAAGVSYSEEALYAADLPAKSVYMIALPVPGTDTRVLTGRGPAASSCCAYAAEARTRTWSSGVSSTSTATAVCDPLCGSTPIITTATTCPFPHIHARREPRRACLYYGSVIVAPLTSHAHHPGRLGRRRVAGLRQRQRGLGLGSAAPAERHGSHGCRGRRAAGAAGYLAEG